MCKKKTSSFLFTDVLTCKGFLTNSIMYLYCYFVFVGNRSHSLDRTLYWCFLEIMLVWKNTFDPFKGFLVTEDSSRRMESLRTSISLRRRAIQD